MSSPEPRNPFYLLLLLASLLFVLTALAYTFVPLLEQKAADAGQPPPPSDFRDALRGHGWLWLLAEVAVLVVLGLASMGLDRLRSLQKHRNRDTIPSPGGANVSPHSSTVTHASQDQPSPEGRGTAAADQPP
jgi:hypothetical protein